MDVHPDGPGADKDPVVDRDPAVLVKDEHLDVPDKDEDIDGPGKDADLDGLSVD